MAMSALWQSVYHTAVTRGKRANQARTAYIYLGMSYYHLQQQSKAKAAFVQAANVAKDSTMTRQWISYLNR